MCETNNTKKAQKLPKNQFSVRFSFFFGIQEVRDWLFLWSRAIYMDCNVMVLEWHIPISKWSWLRMKNAMNSVCWQENVKKWRKFYNFGTFFLIKGI